MKTILVLGAASGMAEAITYRFAKDSYQLILGTRNVASLSDLTNELQEKFGSTIHVVEFDAVHFETHKSFYDSLPVKPDVVLCAFGYLGNHSVTRNDFGEVQKIIHTNYTGAVSILDIVANDFERRRSGTIIGISSVAGERGRKSNYHYGSAKAAFTAYLSGLRQRLHSTGVHVMTVKPGFVRTRMTEEMKLPRLLTTSPENSAEDIYRAFRRRRNVVYTPFIWRYTMVIIRHIPESIFKKTNF